MRTASFLALAMAVIVVLPVGMAVPVGSPLRTRSLLSADSVLASPIAAALGGAFGSSVSLGPDPSGLPVGALLVGSPNQLGVGSLSTFLAHANPAFAADAQVQTALPAVITVANAPTGLGWSVAQIGDFNGDGYADFVVSARDSSSTLVAMLLVLGGPTPNQFVVVPVQTYWGGSYEVQPAGDINGDGLADFFVLHDHEAYVVFGTHDVPAMLGTTSFVPIDDGGQVASIAAIGDVFGDGHADFAIGTDYGTVEIFHGPRAPAPDVFGFPFLAKQDVTIFARDLSVEGPAYVAAAGDFDGDGISDILVGTPGDAYHAAAILFGTRGAWPSTAQPCINSDCSDAQGVLELLGPGHYLGAAVAGVGNVLADGRSAVLVATSCPPTLAPCPAGGGEAYLLGGRAQRGSLDLATSAGLHLVTSTSNELMLVPAGGADLNLDGYPDFAIGSPNAPGGGAVYVFFGGPQLNAGVSSATASCSSATSDANNSTDNSSSNAHHDAQECTSTGRSRYATYAGPTGDIISASTSSSTTNRSENSTSDTSNWSYSSGWATSATAASDQNQSTSRARDADAQVALASAHFQRAHDSSCSVTSASSDSENSSGQSGTQRSDTTCATGNRTSVNASLAGIDIVEAQRSHETSQEQGTSNGYADQGSPQGYASGGSMGSGSWNNTTVTFLGGNGLSQRDDCSQGSQSSSSTTEDFADGSSAYHQASDSASGSQCSHDLGLTAVGHNASAIATPSDCSSWQAANNGHHTNENESSVYARSESASGCTARARGTADGAPVDIERSNDCNQFSEATSPPWTDSFGASCLTNTTVALPDGMHAWAAYGWWRYAPPCSASVCYFDDYDVTAVGAQGGPLGDGTSESGPSPTLGLIEQIYPYLP